LAVKVIKAIIKANNKKVIALAIINNLFLPLVLAFRLIIIVLIVIISIILLGKTIIKVSVNIIHLIDKEN
jgi:hypothetical protein